MLTLMYPNGNNGRLFSEFRLHIKGHGYIGALMEVAARNNRGLLTGVLSGPCLGDGVSLVRLPSG